MTGPTFNVSGVRKTRLPKGQGFAAMHAKMRGLPPPPRHTPEEIASWPEPEPERQSYVYFIEAGPGGPVKIGRTRNPETRLATLQTSHHAECRLLATAPGDWRVERAYHQQFAASLIRGEWFTRCPEIEAEIARLTEVSE